MNCIKVINQQRQNGGQVKWQRCFKTRLSTIGTKDPSKYFRLFQRVREGSANAITKLFDNIINNMKVQSAVK